MKYKEVLEISKNFLEKEHNKKVQSLKDKKEKQELLKYLILSKIKLMHLEIEDLLRNSQHFPDFKILSLKSSIIPYKITFLELDFNKEDFKKMIVLINKIKLRLSENGAI